MKPTLVVPLLVVFFVVTIGYISTESVWTLFAGLVLFAFYLNERMHWSRTYITEIREMPDNQIKITYLDKDEVKEYVGNKKSFRVQRNSVWYTMRADKEQYLVFKDEQKGFSLKQYALGEWEDEMINQVAEDWQPEEADIELTSNTIYSAKKYRLQSDIEHRPL